MRAADRCARRRAAAACRTRCVGFGEACRRRSSRAAPPGGCARPADAAAGSVAIACEARRGVGAVERGQRQAGVDLRLDARHRSRRRLRSRSSATRRSSSDRSISRDRVEPHAGVGTREREARHGRAQHAPQPVVRADLGQLVRRRGAGVLQRQRDRSGRATAALSSADLTMKTFWSLVAEVEPVVEQRRQDGASARMAALRSAARRSLPCRRSWPRAARRASTRNVASSGDCA